MVTNDVCCLGSANGDLNGKHGEAGHDPTQRAKRPRGAINDLRREMVQAWLDGADIEMWFKRIAVARKVEFLSGVEICDFASNKSAMDAPGLELIGYGASARTKGGMTLEPGCAVSVIPSAWLMHLILEPSEGSKRVLKFIAESKHAIKKTGQWTVRLRTTDGSRRRMVIKVAAANKILVPIAGICDNGNMVRFRKDGGTITNVDTHRETYFRRVGSVFVLYVTEGGVLPGVVAVDDFDSAQQSKQYQSS